MKKKIDDLPRSDDEYWEGAEKQMSSPKRVPLCQSHFKNWEEHNGYLDNHDGTMSCKYCPWGARIPGYMRIHDERVVDFRKL